MGLEWERLGSNLEKRLGENEKGKKKEERPLYFEGGERNGNKVTERKERLLKGISRNG